MRTVFVFFFLIPFLSLCQDTIQTNELYKKGLKEYESGNFETAKNIFLKAAELGDAASQNKLGDLFVKGNGVEININEALSWYLKAANQNNEDALDNLGWMNEFGKGVEINYSEALLWYKKSAELGSAYSQYRLGSMYNEGKGLDKNLSIAIDYYDKAARKGHARAQSQLGYLLVFGDSSVRKVNEGIEWLKKAADQNNSSAQTNLGYVYDLGIGVERDLLQSVKYYKKAADQGNETAKKNLRIIYKNKEFKERTGIPGLDSLLFLPLKHELTSEDKFLIKKEIAECFKIEPNVSFSVDVGDLYPDKQGKKEEPANMKRAGELKEKLIANPDDFNTCLALAGAYLQLHKLEEANHFFDRAESLAKNKLLKNSNDSIQYYNLGTIYLKKENYQKAVEEFEIFYQYNQDYKSISSLFISYWALKDFKKANSYAREYISKHPSDPSGYFMVLTKEMGKAFQDTSHLGSKTVEEIADLSLLSEFAKGYSNDLRPQFLLEESRLMILFYKILITSARSNFTEIKPTHYDLHEINKLDSFFLSVTSPSNIGKFPLNKSLAVVKMLLSEYDKAINYCKEAIASKKHEVSRHNSNSAGVYDLIAFIYMLKKDTLNALKTVREKITKTTDTYQTADDQCRLARFKLWQRDFLETEKALKAALVIDPLTQDAFIGLATLEILNGDLKTAKDFLLKATSCGEDNASIKTLNGIIWMEIGDGVSAKQSFNEALQLDKDFEPAKRILKKYFVEP